MVRRGRRFESVRGLFKSPGKRGFFFCQNWHDLQCAVGMEPFMEPSGLERNLFVADRPQTSRARRDKSEENLASAYDPDWDVIGDVPSTTKLTRRENAYMKNRSR
jgi:hypothetical protein